MMLLCNLYWPLAMSMLLLRNLYWVLKYWYLFVCLEVYFSVIKSWDFTHLMFGFFFVWKISKYERQLSCVAFTVVSKSISLWPTSKSAHMYVPDGSLHIGIITLYTETMVQIFVDFDIKYSRLEVHNASMLLNNIIYYGENLLCAIGIRSVAIIVCEHCRFRHSKMSRWKFMMFYVVNVFIPPMWYAICCTQWRCSKWCLSLLHQWILQYFKVHCGNHNSLILQSLHCQIVSIFSHRNWCVGGIVLDWLLWLFKLIFLDQLFHPILLCCFGICHAINKNKMCQWKKNAI